MSEQAIRKAISELTQTKAELRNHRETTDVPKIGYLTRLDAMRLITDLVDDLERLGELLEAIQRIDSRPICDSCNGNGCELCNGNGVS